MLLGIKLVNKCFYLSFFNKITLLRKEYSLLSILQKPPAAVLFKVVVLLLLIHSVFVVAPIIYGAFVFGPFVYCVAFSVLLA